MLEYTGERITKEEGDTRYEGRPFTYLFGLGDGDIVIDGHGMAMFVNHSCQPNCETDEIDGRVYIQTIRELKPGEELTYDYWLYDGDDDAPCHCGAKSVAAACTLPRSRKSWNGLKPRHGRRQSSRPSGMAREPLEKMKRLVSRGASLPLSRLAACTSLGPIFTLVGRRLRPPFHLIISVELIGGAELHLLATQFA